ncbi:sugar phosphate isomerase/epimerase family protein [Granulicella sp. S156]|jgi:5-keto-L-gluconate epimerase|uniref:sugar phosphate isomerase/epimerase family protein n=1 Tax=Granulicella sp. S156 TaxID=1747224 RepID=UPI00131B6E62|nr:sugar phosphate isomerase/epimerase family protein [Granulicella sp. S156]
MKIGLAVSTKDALPSAYVVYRDDLGSCIDRCAELGYDGVELALRDASQVDVQRIKQRLAATGLEIPCISTGQVFAADHLYFTHPDGAVRTRAIERIIDMIRLASEFNAKVNIGRVRGTIHSEDTLDAASRRYIDCVCQCAYIAEPLGVELLVEPVNRYEVNFINNCAQGIELIRESGLRCVRLMPDTFHMNIEDASFRDAFLAARDFISYVHVADSNRLAPGWGHVPLDEIFQILGEIGYNDWITAEILPEPNPDAAARQAIKFLRSRFSRDVIPLATTVA